MVSSWNAAGRGAGYAGAQVRQTIPANKQLAIDGCLFARIVCLTSPREARPARPSTTGTC